MSRRGATSKTQAECSAGTLQRRGSQCTECAGTQSYSSAHYPQPRKRRLLCLSWSFYCREKQGSPKQLGISVQLSGCTPSRQGRKLEAGLTQNCGGVLAQPAFLGHPGPLPPGVVPPTVRRALPHQPRETTTHSPTGKSHGGTTQGPSSQVTLAFVKLTLN